jgi:peroxiredoxin
MSRVGKKAPDFSLPDHRDKTWTNRDWAGKWLVLIFHRHLG